MSCHTDCATCASSKFHACGFGLACGVIKGLFLLLFAWSAMWWGYGQAGVDQISLFYQGYGATFTGGLLGGLYGFICGFIFGFIFAKLYNLFLCCCPFRRCRETKSLNDKG